MEECGRERFTLLTLDKDFGELVYRRGAAAENGVILFRVDSFSPEEFAAFVLNALRSRSDWDRAFTVITRDRIRMRPLPT